VNSAFLSELAVEVVMLVALCQDRVRQCGSVDNTIDIVEMISSGSASKVGLLGTFEANCNSAPNNQLD
jgi:hypothetical protein